MSEARALARHFGQNLARSRKLACLSQEELGVLASLHRTEIGMLERGIRLPRIDTLIKLAGALEIPPAELLEGMSWTPAYPVIGRFGLRSEAQAGRSSAAGAKAPKASSDQ